MKTEMRSFGGGERVGHDSGGFYDRRMYEGSAQNGSDRAAGLAEADLAEVELPAELRNQVFVHSSEDMHELPDNSVHLMVTSPPYNVGKDYDDDLTFDQYRDLLRNVWRETHRVLVDGGRACVNVANIGRKPYIPLNAIVSADMVDLGFLMRGEIIWNKAASAGASCAWGSWMSAANPVLRDVHEYILVFSKNNFSRTKKDGAKPEAKATAKSSGKTEFKSKGKIGAKTEFKSTIEKDDFLEWTKSIWTFRAESAKSVGHPAPFPVELPRRLIELYTFEGDIVLDPFMGSGTTAVASQSSGRFWIGYEVSKHYAAMAADRVADN